MEENRKHTERLSDFDLMPGEADNILIKFLNGEHAIIPADVVKRLYISQKFRNVGASISSTTDPDGKIRHKITLDCREMVIKFSKDIPASECDL